MPAYEMPIRKVNHNRIYKKMSMTDRCQLWDADSKTSYTTLFPEIFDTFCYDVIAYAVGATDKSRLAWIIFCTKTLY